jgi:hypothetical protein
LAILPPLVAALPVSREPTMYLFLVASVAMLHLLALNLNNDFCDLIPDVVAFVIILPLARRGTFARIKFCLAAMAYTKSLGVDLNGLLKRNIHTSPQNATRDVSSNFLFVGLVLPQRQSCVTGGL